MTQADVKLLFMGAVGGRAIEGLVTGRWEMLLYYIVITAAIFLFVQPRPFSA